ncbi:MAG: hypothetical protein J5997_10700 [Oscillospiraceae bacterium]|nr:hypothetical protein [Oscillospiraceae bacterium]
MKKFLGVLFSVFGFVLNAIILCGLMIVGIDLVNRYSEEKKASSGGRDK